MKHILVTGAAGFIGSHLCDALLAKGYAVTGLDNLLTGRRENLEAASRHRHFSYVERDVCAPLEDSHLPLVARHGLHGVLHFACPASPVDFDRIPFEILAVDSIGTGNTVELAPKHGARYLVASTSEIYGDPLVHPQTEDYWGNVNTIGPRACYDEAKRFAEAYVSTAIRAWVATPGASRARRQRRDHPHLQYVRPAHAAGRRAHRARLCIQALKRRAADVARRRQADAQLLLCLGSRGRHHPAL